MKVLMMVMGMMKNVVMKIVMMMMTKLAMMTMTMARWRSDATVAVNLMTMTAMHW